MLPDLAGLRWFAPPVLATADLTARARALWKVSWGTVGLGVVFLAIVVAIEPESFERRVVTLTGLVAIGAVIQAVSRRGLVDVASWGLVALLMAFLTQRAWITSGIHGPITPLYLVLIMMGGVLLGARGAWLTAFGAVVCATLLAVAEQQGWVAPWAAFASPITTLVLTVVIIAISLVMQRMITGAISASLQRAEAEVAERKRTELERERLLHDVGERVKELRLLHHVAQATHLAWRSDADLLEHIVNAMPAAWQYPEITVASITLGEIAVTSPAWRETEWMQSARFVTGNRRGSIRVAYTERRPPSVEGPFMAEERAVLDSVAEMLAAHLDSMRSRHELESLVETRTAELRSARDSAERVAAELAESLGRLRELERSRDGLVHMILHDMRGLLSVVLANLELASFDATGQVALDIADASRAAEAITRMANTVIDVSRLEDGKLPVKRVSTDVAVLATETARTFGAMDASRVIRCTATGPVMAVCDADLVRRVIENLVSNGIKHTPQGGSVTVDARCEDGRLCVSVRDEGVGVPEEVRAHLFEKFAATRKDSKFHSAGLGLAFCRLAVEAHGGTIGVEPAVPRGSIFAFTIPA